MAEEAAAPAAPEAAPAAEGEEAAGPAGDVDCSFVIMPENFKHSTTLGVGSSGAEIKQALAKDLPLPVDAMSLKNKGETVSDEQTLAELGYKVRALAPPSPFVEGLPRRALTSSIGFHLLFPGGGPPVVVP